MKFYNINQIYIFHYYVNFIFMNYLITLLYFILFFSTTFLFLPILRIKYEIDIK